MAKTFSSIFRTMTAAGALLILVGCGSAEDRAKGYYQSGMEYLQNKDYAKAAIEFRNAIKLDENYADAWLGMALIEQQAQNWDRFYGDLRKVLEIDPKNLRALVAMATLLSLSGDYAGALKSINEAAIQQPDNADVRALKASVLYKLDDKAGAIAEAQAALKQKPNHPEASLILVADQLAKGDGEAALKTVDGVIAANPGNLALYLMKLRVLEKTGDVARQESGIRELVAAFPDKKEYRQALSSFLASNGKTGQAEKELRETLTANPEDSDLGLELVRFLLTSRGDAAARAELQGLIAASKQPFPYQMALADLDLNHKRESDAEALLRGMAQSLGINENGIAARLRLSAYLLGARRFTEAQVFIDEVIKNDAQNAEGLTQRALLLIETGKVDDAINDLRTALNNDPKNANVHQMLASAYERNGQIELAAKEFSDAYEVSSRSPRSGLAYVGFLQRRGNTDRAEEVLRDLDARNAGNREILTALSAFLTRKGDWKGAEEIARRLAEAAQGPKSDVLIGASLMGQKRYDDAIEIYKKAVSSQPGDRQGLAALVNAYVAAGKLAEADAFLASVLEASPANATAIALRGIVQYKNNQPDQAKASFETAIAKDPAASIGYQSLADILATQDKMPDAIKVLNDGIRNVKDNGSLRLSLAARLEQQGNFEEAIGQYDVLMADQSNSLVVVNNLVSLLTDHRTDKESLDRAVAMAQILRSSPVPQFRETLGWALVLSGNTREGLGLLERVATELGDVSTVQYHLGMAYAKAGQKDLAAKHLNMALGLEKLAGAQEKIKKALAELQTQSNP